MRHGAHAVPRGRYTVGMKWNVEGTDEFGAWYGSLDDAATKAVNAAIDALAEGGPGLGRQWWTRSKVHGC